MEQIRDGSRVLVADIGGTYARFSYVDAELGIETLTPPIVLETDDFASFGDVVQEVLDETGRPKVSAAAVCGAGPIIVNNGDASIDMTNCPWQLTEADLKARLDTPRVQLVNDFAAIAHALPLFDDEELLQIGTGVRDPAGPLAVLGAGTGLGVAGLIPDGRGQYALIDGEGGHVDIAPANTREIAIYERLLRRFGHVNAETILSGSGLEALHDALCEMEGLECEPVSAPEIAARAATGGEPVSAEAVHCFTNWLGAAAANVALTIGATGGVYIAGGIVPQWGGLFEGPRFRARFEDRGKISAYVKPIPTYLVIAPDPALKGLAQLGSALLTD
ncbi:MAG: glucokinase [Parvibaculaceae bacterium]|nr:glucokinase [Parvibaculaceae bacterium]HBM89055.1 glucokinase [Rhodobiaceae bacterium]|tara:strand:+ start:10322 stop:11320 length:999 start_codon:yes stop_codon:yes gene_type:complete